MIFKHKSKIKFHAGKEILASVPHPVPANKLMPAWFKKIKPTCNEAADSSTIKRCVPVLDAVSQGYIIPLWADLHVAVTKCYNFKDKDGKVIHTEGAKDPNDLIGKITDNTKETIASYEDTGDLSVWMKFPELMLDNIPLALENHSWDQVGEACDLKKFKLGKVLMKFVNPWTIKTPPGYSVQIKNPSSNWEYDIQLIEGVIDTDEYYAAINLPFVWTGKVTGDFIVPQGTPLAQVIPFKRDNYILEVAEVDLEARHKVEKRLSTRLVDRYKSMFWHKRKP